MNYASQRFRSAFTDLYSSEKYAEVMRELSTAGVTYKIKQRKVVEMVLRALDVPTRTELDDAYRTLYELRKDMKAVKKQLAAVRQEQQALSLKTQQEPARRAPQKAGPRSRKPAAKKSPARKS